ncbi:MAG: hypothetical protein AAFO07_31130 [Bacteroidota bacterium]
MKKYLETAGGQLIVLESQSNSGKNHCRLAIRKVDVLIDDLTPAYKK